MPGPKIKNTVKIVAFIAISTQCVGSMIYHWIWVKEIRLVLPFHDLSSHLASVDIVRLTNVPHPRGNQLSSKLTNNGTAAPRQSAYQATTSKTVTESKENIAVTDVDVQTEMTVGRDFVDEATGHHGGFLAWVHWMNGVHSLSMLSEIVEGVIKEIWGDMWRSVMRRSDR
ncbi:hypothetical protein DFJ43DRAFT_1043904 [Lentinula guzmanii]|uniref:Uncharacterized protein n=1 Tax=Lentinula guzmanii TaxID=2804957 RepID=A0AA38J798_9AGAR|nr:hypothetical protein DFJ43DRAFT_1043904 [Lentinula guzmanii]